MGRESGGKDLLRVKLDAALDRAAFRIVSDDVVSVPLRANLKGKHGWR